jgi:hypothetical protein
MEGRWFASGTATADQLLPAGKVSIVPVKLPVAFQGVTVSGEPTSLEVGVRGGLWVSLPGLGIQRLPFEGKKRIIADGAPVVRGLGEEE